MRHAPFRTILALAAALALFRCGAPVPDASPPGRADRPNVLLITLDTTRADRLGCYGHVDARTPALDGLAASGAVFEQAFCQVPLTLPSHASLLTGTYPISNGVRINGATALTPGLTTLPEVFRANGYRTGAFVAAAVLDEVFGLGRGFDHYDDDLGAMTTFGAAPQERPGDAVADAALAWLGGDSSSPFFAWVHFFDPHDPYDPPPPYGGPFSDPYDGEIAFVDAQIARLLEWLEASGLSDRTLIVVAGDHGEAFGEHDETHHGLFVYETTMRVPLIAAYPGTLPGGCRVEEVVSLVDVFPTIIDLLGWHVPAEVEGVSLATACADGVPPPPAAYGESEYARLGFGWAPLGSLTTDRWKYIEAPRPELYDRGADPGELVNAVDAHPDVAARLEAELRTRRDAMVAREASAVAPDPEMLRRLQALGYVGGTTRPADDRSVEARDPKDMLAAYRQYLRANSLRAERRFEEIVPLLEPAVRKSPESDAFYVPLAIAYLELGRFADAERAFEASLRQAPTLPDRLWGLGVALLRQGRLPAAAARFEAALDVSPEYVDAHLSLGHARELEGRPAEAARHYRRAVELAPDLALAHDMLGDLLVAQGNPAEARAHFQRGVELEPGAAEPRVKLGAVLFLMDRYPEAAEALGEAVAIEPANARAHQGLWRALAASGDLAAAMRALRTAHESVPGDALLTHDLAWLLATTARDDLRNPREALDLIARVCPRVDSAADCPAPFLDAAAAAHAALGEFTRAVELGERGVALARARNDVELARAIAERVRLYRSGRPHRE